MRSGIMDRLHHDERGISAVLVVICLVVLFGAAVLTVDSGSVWQSRRQAIQATDDGALREARQLAFAGSIPVGCTGVYQNAINDNIPANLRVPLQSSDGSACEVTITNPTYNLGYVAVQTRKLSPARFSGIFGIGDQNAYSMSVARWGIPTNVKGLRPIGICKNDPHMIEWRRLNGDRTAGTPITLSQYGNLTVSPNDWDDLNGDGDRDEPLETAHYSKIGETDTYRRVVHRIRFFRDTSEELGCGSDPGNWGWMDYGDDGNASSHLARELLYGYQGFKGVSGCGSQPGPGPGCSGDTGNQGGGSTTCDKNPNTVSQALQCLVESQLEFPIVMYDTATCTTSGRGGGGGANCKYQIYQLIGVILRGFKMTGAESERYFDFSFVPMNVEGGCCLETPPLGFDSKLRVVFICGIDHDNAPALTVASRCGPPAVP